MKGLEDKIQKIIDRYRYIESCLEKSSYDSSFTALLKERANMEEIFQECVRYQNIQSMKNDIAQQLEVESDIEMIALMQDESLSLIDKENKCKEKLKILLLPKDSDDNKSVIIEIRAGAGGEEAALFVAVLFGMYSRYAEKQGWKVEIDSMVTTGLDGYREIIASIDGDGAFSRLKFESGVHRVQRVPETEASGRIHTSTATVAILPKVEDVDIEIRNEDLRIDVYRASGAGGQHVNKTDSAVRITHIPTGEVVAVQDGRSQHQNKAKAMQILKSRLYNAKKQEQDAKIASIKKDQVKSGERSDKIRTYNYQQNRITDHRINLTIYALDSIIRDGNFDEFIAGLTMDDQMKKLANENEE